MSRGAWRGAETLQKRRREQLAIERAEERARKRRREIVKEWHVTGEAAFRPTERSYPNGGGVHGVAEFLASTERALHLYDRGKTLTREMSATLTTLERRHVELSNACREFSDKHTLHGHPHTKGHWEVGKGELQLFAEAAQRMTPTQRQAFVDVLTPHRDKSKAHIGSLEPLAARLQRAKNASIEQAVSGALFNAVGDASSGGVGRFSRGLRAVRQPCIAHDSAGGVESYRVGAEGA